MRVSAWFASKVNRILLGEPMLEVGLIVQIELGFLLAAYVQLEQCI